MANDPVFAFITENLAAGLAGADILELLGVPRPQLPKTTAAHILAYFRMHAGVLPRAALASVSTLDHAVGLFRTSRRILIISGAGVSVSAGVPDFRSPHSGLYDILRRSGDPALEAVGDPQEIFDVNVFKSEPELFYSVAHLLYDKLDATSPTLTHRFFRALDAEGRLLRLYTQNIDGLDARAGVSPARLVEAHGTLATASCLRCGRRFPSAQLRKAVAAREVARCPGASCGGLLKPDAVFFHEPLPAAFGDALDADASVADLCVIVGSSMRVRPVADIPGRLPPHVPLLVINLEALGPAEGGGLGVGGGEEGARPQADARAGSRGRSSGAKRPRPAAAPRPAPKDRFLHAPDVQLLGPADVVCGWLWERSGLLGRADSAAASGTAAGAAAAVASAATEAGSLAGAAACLAHPPVSPLPPPEAHPTTEEPGTLSASIAVAAVAEPTSDSSSTAAAGQALPVGAGLQEEEAAAAAGSTSSCSSSDTLVRPDGLRCYRFTPAAASAGDKGQAIDQSTECSVGGTVSCEADLPPV